MKRHGSEAKETVERTITMPLGVVVERRELDNRWQKVSWRPVAVIPGAAPLEDWRELARGDRWVRYHMATLPLELHRKETLAYKTNLASQRPMVFVILRTTSAAPPERKMAVFKVTASPFEAQDYLDSGDDLIEGVAMPEGLIAWVDAFCDRHHVDEPFKKRKRQDAKAKDEPFSARPPITQPPTTQMQGGTPKGRANGRG
jgi:hypothetical protein